MIIKLSENSYYWRHFALSKRLTQAHFKCPKWSGTAGFKSVMVDTKRKLFVRVVLEVSMAFNGG
tara:strand:- start:1310 stop:1501 length:192 start_codon:yes stop_codon:yes gene_type:complete